MSPNQSNGAGRDSRHAPADRAPDGRRERWRVHRETRRRELVRAVIEAVREHGADIGMDDIASVTGVAKPVFYRYFADKADLHLAVGQALAAVVAREVTTALEAHDRVRDMLAAGIGHYLALIEAQPELYRFVVNGPAVARGARSDPVADYSSLLGLHVARLVGERLREAGADAGAAEPWGFALVGSVRSAADRWLAQPTMSREALAAYLTDFAWRGMSALEPAPSTVRALRPRRDESAG